MTSSAEACLLIKWRDVAALSLRYYCPLRDGQKYSYTGVLRPICSLSVKNVPKTKKFAIFGKIIAKKFGGFKNSLYLCNKVAKSIKSDYFD